MLIHKIFYLEHFKHLIINYIVIILILKKYFLIYLHLEIIKN